MGMKGHPQSNCGNGVGGSGGISSGGCGWMKKKKMAMLAVVILVAVIGVMVVQKVRDRRLFNLVIKDKDRQIISLHLLLQKERQYAKESKRKNQDLNAKLYSLRTQKNELNNKIMEMQSTIGSIKDEQRALEIAIEEKQNEIKVKESQIKDLKSPQTPPKIWSVGSDDPSNREVNLTDKVTTTKRSSWFGQSSNEQKLNYQESTAKGKLQKPKEDSSGITASLKEGDLTLNHNGAMKTEIHNTTEVRLAVEENGKKMSLKPQDLSIKGRKSFIEANGSQTDVPADKNRPKANREEYVTEVPRLKSKNYSTEAFHQAADRTDEDEAETEADTNSSIVSGTGNGLVADQDYKEETED